MMKKLSQTPKAAPVNPRRSTLFLLAAILLLALGTVAIFFRPWTDSRTPTAASEPVDSFYMPADFQHLETLLLGGAQLAELQPDVLAGIVKAASPEVSIRVLAGSPADRSRIETVLADCELPGTTVDILQLPILTMWIRDFGPVTVSDAEGRRSMVDFLYRGGRGNARDDGVPTSVAMSMGFNLLGSRLLAEGGEYLSNGRGLCLVSTRMISRNADHLAQENAQVMANFAAILGFETLSMVPPLQGESTGHVDMFCAFLKPDLIVVGDYEPVVDPYNAARLDLVVERLEEFPTRAGPLQVERLPMPDHDDGVWRTYTNIVFANGILLVPVYPDYCPDLDEVALATYRRLLPDRRVVGLDASQLSRMNGGLRGLTMNIPSDRPLLSADVTPDH